MDLLSDDTYQLDTVDGRLCAVWPDGKTLPIVRGGDGPEGEGEGDDDSSGEGEGEGEGDEGKPKPKPVADDDMTDAVKAAVEKAVGRARKKWESDLKAAGDREKMDEADKLKAEKAEAEAKAAEREAAANQRLVLADAKVAAVAAGVKADRVATFLRVVNLDDIDVDDDGEVDAKALKTAIDKALKDVPEFKGEASKGGDSGGEHGGGKQERAKNLEDAVAKRLAS